MNRIKVKSSAVVSVGYTEPQLEVEFNNGDVYQYDNVDRETYVQLMNSTSKGRFITEKIANTYNFTKVI